MRRVRSTEDQIIGVQRIHDTAHLDELLPVSAVSGEARHLARRDRADLAEADLGDHALEASARCAASRRTTKILVVVE